MFEAAAPRDGELCGQLREHAESLDVQAKELLLRMSPSTMDRLLRVHRVRTSLWRGHGGPMALMKRQVPVRAERWEGRGPGWF